MEALLVRILTYTLPLVAFGSLSLAQYFSTDVGQEAYIQGPTLSSVAQDRRVSRLLWKALIAFEAVLVLVSQITNHDSVIGYIKTVYWACLLATAITIPGDDSHMNGVACLCIFPMIDSLFFVVLPLFANPPQTQQIETYVAVMLQAILLIVPLATPQTWKPLFDEDEREKANPEQTCTPFSYYVSYQWIEYLVRIACRREIVLEDLPPLPDYDRAEIWQERILQARRESLLRTILSLMSRELITMSGLAFMISVTQFISPLAIQRLLLFLENPETARFSPYLWVILLLVGPLLWAISREMYIFVSTRLTIRVKSALTQLIYLKVIKLSSDDRNESNAIGKISNLMSSDIETITMAREVFLLFVQLPICTVVSLVLLYQLMGYAALIGFGVLLLTIPIPGLLASSMANLQQEASLATDVRLAATNESLGAIRTTKMFGWEQPRMNAIRTLRHNEQIKLWHRNFVAIVIGFVTDVLPSVNMFTTFLVYTLIMKKPLSPSIAFTSISYFEILRSQFLWVGYIARNVIQSQVSLKRIEDFLDVAAEVPTNADVSLQKVAFESANCSWSGTADTESFKLEDLNVTFERGLNLVLGPTGSGKTSMLLALLGEMHNTSGRVHLNRIDGIAYVSQSPWLQNTTVRGNILFGAPFNTHRYQAVVKACGLAKDFRDLDHSDSTQVGEKGTVLSGGQKQRVCLARALYSSAQTLLLDDVLSALDSATATHVFHNAIRGPLNDGKTVILVTHAVNLCSPFAKQIVSLVNGTTVIRRRESVMELDNCVVSEVSNPRRQHRPHHSTHLSNVNEQLASSTGALPYQDKGILASEDAAIGRISRGAIFLLLKDFGSNSFLLLLILTQLIYQALTVLRSLFPGIWSDAYDVKGEDLNIGFYLGMYAFIILTNSLFNTFCNIFVYRGNWQAAGKLHERLLVSIFQTRLAWFDHVPIGRVLNRFTRDIQSLDTIITPWIRMSIDGIFKVIFTTVSITAVLPMFAVPAATAAVFGLLIGELYTQAQVAVKRLVSISESPLFSHFGDTITGITTIRAFGAQSRFAKEMQDRIDAHTRPLEVLYALTRWSQIRADTLGALVSFSAAMLALLGPVRDAGLIGFSLATASGFSVTLLNLVRALNEMEVELNSFERINEYASLAKEPESLAPDEPPETWSGDIIVENFSAAYSHGLPLILKQLNFTIANKEKIGVVGRTGSGKSTLGLSLLRLTHRVGGSIHIGGLELENISPETLRRRISIIPQDPVLFSGTVRSNLDPFEMYSDSQLFGALAQSGLDGVMLDSIGSNFSQGQRQLLALARAILKRSNLIILDEATANCDAQTDAHIQHILRTEFCNSTVLTIAHRLRTICDYDRIMVLQNGHIIEFDSPTQLMLCQRGIFKGLVEESDDAVEIRKIIQEMK